MDRIVVSVSGYQSQGTRWPSFPREWRMLKSGTYVRALSDEEQEVGRYMAPHQTVQNSSTASSLTDGIHEQEDTRNDAKEIPRPCRPWVFSGASARLYRWLIATSEW